MERGRSRKARSGCLGRIFGFVLFLIVAAVGVIAAVKYMPSRERADLDALYAAGGSDRVALYLNYERQFEDAITFKIALMVVKYMKYMESKDTY